MPVRLLHAHAGGLMILALSLDPILAMAQTAEDSGADGGAASIIADQIRDQGHRCDKPVSAQRDPTLSQPDLPVWILQCANATYRVTVRGSMASTVEEITP
jgi:hypothetical protein